MEQTTQTPATRVVGPLTYLLFLMRAPLLVTAALIVLLLDFVIPGSMKEALRYALLDRSLWYQFVVIGVALALACAAIRFSCEAIVELVSPDLYDHAGSVSRVAKLLPRFLALSVGLALAWPLISIVLDWSVLQNDAESLALSVHGRFFWARCIAAGAAAAYILIAFFIAVIAKGPHTPERAEKDPPPLMRLGFALFPLLLAVTFAVAVLGIWQNGVADGAVERYSAGLIGAVSDRNDTASPLVNWIYLGRDGNAERSDCDQRNAARRAGRLDGEPEWCETAMRYQDYVQTREVPNPQAPDHPTRYVESTVSPFYVIAMLASLFVACVAARLALAIFLDVLLPWLGRFLPPLRRIIPPLGALGLAAGVAAQVFDVYLGPQHIPYYKSEVIAGLGRVEPERLWAMGIIAAYLLIGLLACLGRGSRFVGEGGWRDSPSFGRRMMGAARRLAALDPFWRWGIRALIAIGLIIFVMFSNLHDVQIPQWIGPVGIMLLWGATVVASLFLLSYLGHMTRIPFLSILILAVLAFAGFDINDNHQIRTIARKSDMAAATPQTLDLIKWIGSRPDKAMYAHYPVFLVATEGGGIRAAYFTANVLAALQERCPGFAQHTIAISGVSGGSLGASVFAALSADDAKSAMADPACRLDGVRPGALVKRARGVLSADLLSPLLGAMLFPDALQRMIPVPVRAFDRSRALEYAVEDAWRSNAPGCTGDACNRLGLPAGNLYMGDGAHVVPNLFLNTTEAGSGDIISIASAQIGDEGTPYRNRAQIDDRNLDCVENGGISNGNCVKPRKANLTLALLLDPSSTIPLSTATFMSARFPYLTPAATVPETGGKHVDGGYFENSGTFLLSELVQNLVGQQLCLRPGSNCPGVDASSPDAEIARNAVFVVVVIQSEPCTRYLPGDTCEEDKPGKDDSFSELMSPVRALLSTRDQRAAYSIADLGSMSALVEQMQGDGTPDDGISCDHTVCAVTLEFLNRRNTEIPLTWLLSAGARRQMDVAVSDMERADVRFAPPPSSMTNVFAPGDRSHVLGSYRRVLCLLADRKDGLKCAPTPPLATQ